MIRYIIVIAGFIAILIFFWFRGKEDFRRGYDAGRKIGDALKQKEDSQSESPLSDDKR